MESFWTGIGVFAVMCIGLSMVAVTIIAIMCLIHKLQEAGWLDDESSCEY